METNDLPVAIIGTGPIGLAAAAHLLRRGETPLLFEAGPSVGKAVLKWGHVRLFSPWRYPIDREAAALLETDGWLAPDPEAYPTGRELVEDYLAPLANTPRIKPHLHLDTRVVVVTRQGIDKMKTPGREQAPFVLRLRATSGEEQDVLARAVIDASGTYETPNPLGAHGIPARGERALREHIFYGIPDILGTQQERTPGEGRAIPPGWARARRGTRRRRVAPFVFAPAFREAPPEQVRHGQVEVVVTHHGGPNSLMLKNLGMSCG